MISVKVEKEIKQENRVIGRFTLRQSICLGVSAALIALFAIIFRPSTDVLMGFGLGTGGLAWLFGFYKRSGLYIEYFLIKRIKLISLKNQKRLYRTKNAYIRLLNEYYDGCRKKDMAGKKKRRQIKKQEAARKKKKSRLRAYL